MNWTVWTAPYSIWNSIKISLFAELVTEKKPIGTLSIQFQCKITQTISFWARFEANNNWVKNGKLTNCDKKLLLHEKLCLPGTVKKYIKKHTVNRWQSGRMHNEGRSSYIVPSHPFRVRTEPSCSIEDGISAPRPPRRDAEKHSWNWHMLSFHFTLYTP